MQLFLLYTCLFLILQLSVAYLMPKASLKWRGNLKAYDQFSKKPELEDLMRVQAPVDWAVGENVPDEISGHSAIYDMILVERFHDPPTTSFGLFLPTIEGKDKKRLGKILSIPKDYGLESENGRVQPIQEIAPYQTGDVVLIKVKFSLVP